MTLLQAAQGLFPPGVAVALCPIGQAAPLWPDETPFVIGAVPARQAEFAAGRSAARQAMQALGLAPRAIGVGPDRAPVWPDGILGSITLAGGLARAAVGPTQGFGGIGLDLEPETPLEADLVPSIALPAEQDWIARQTEPLIAAKHLFVAKEAAFKAQFPRTRQVFGFETLHVDFDCNRLIARFQTDVPPFRAGDTLTGHFATASGFCLAGFALFHG